MCRELVRRGHKAEIYTTNVDGDGYLDLPLQRPVAFRGVNVTYFPVNGDNYYKLSFSMSAALRKNIERFDVVHIHYLYHFPSAVAAHHCRKHGVPYIVQPHGSLVPYIYKRRALRKRLYEALIERRNLTAAAAALFTTAEEMSLANSSGLSFRGAVVPLGVDLEARKDGAENAADVFWPELVGRKVLLFLGRIHPVKALDLLARAFGAIRRAHADAHLVIAGPDTDGYAAQVRRWLAEVGALDATTFTGMVVDAKKAALLVRANLFVLPSYTENFGIAAVEAMAAALPIVISNRVNIWREIEAARAGLVASPDSRELAKAMLALLENPALAKEMGACGQRMAREQFSWRAAGDQLVQLYRSIHGEKPPMFAKDPR